MYTISSTWRQIYNNFNRSVLAFLEWNFEGFVCVIVGIWKQNSFKMGGGDLVRNLFCIVYLKRD